jgi:hypothetical protein
VATTHREKVARHLRGLGFYLISKQERFWLPDIRSRVDWSGMALAKIASLGLTYLAFEAVTWACREPVARMVEHSECSVPADIPSTIRQSFDFVRVLKLGVVYSYPLGRFQIFCVLLAHWHVMRVIITTAPEEMVACIRFLAISSTLCGAFASDEKRMHLSSKLFLHPPYVMDKHNLQLSSRLCCCFASSAIMRSRFPYLYASNAMYRAFVCAFFRKASTL